MATRARMGWRSVPPSAVEPDGADSSDAAAAAAADRMRTALDLFAMGIELLRTRLRREQPGLSEDDVEQRVERWLLTRRGAEAGDGEGRPVPWPRKRR